MLIYNCQNCFTSTPQFQHVCKCKTVTLKVAFDVNAAKEINTLAGVSEVSMCTLKSPVIKILPNYFCGILLQLTEELCHFAVVIRCIKNHCASPFVYWENGDVVILSEGLPSFPGGTGLMVVVSHWRELLRP